MRGNDRKPIASIKMLPQFTTMNVIDGQAGLVFYSSLIFYILTINNILNIIVLLILAGITISSLTGNGIFTKVLQSERITKIKEAEEISNMYYMARKAEEYSGGVEASLAGVISDLKAENYKIEEKVKETNTVKNIVLNNSKLMMGTGKTALLTYTMQYEDENGVKYYIEIKNKYYEIREEKQKIVIDEQETSIEEITKKREVIAETSNENVVLAEVKGETVELRAGNIVEDVVITIKEISSGKTAICTINVEKLIDDIRTTEREVRVNKGENKNLEYILEPSDATEEMKWKTEDENIAIVDETGKVIGINAGTTKIIVTNQAETIKLEYTIIVEIPASNISLNETTKELKKGDTLELELTTNPVDTTDTITWESSIPGKVSVTQDKEEPKKAVVKAIDIADDGAAQTVTITVDCGGKKAYCTIKVVIPTISVSLNKTTKELRKGETFELELTTNPLNSTDEITWTSSATSKVSVVKNASNSRKATIAGVEVTGTTPITITVVSGGKTATCSVTILPEPAMAIPTTTASRKKQTLTTWGWSKLSQIAEIISDNYGTTTGKINNKTKEVTVTIEGVKYNLAVGDEIEASYNSNSYTVRIVGFNHDILSGQSANNGTYKKEDGTSKSNTYAGISFEFVDVLTSGKINNSGATTGGWKACDMRKTLNGTVYNGLKNNINIKEIDKKYVAIGANSNSLSTCQDYVWLLSSAEIWATGHGMCGSVNTVTSYVVAFEGSQYKYYAQIAPIYRNANSKLSKGSNYWWLRSLAYNETYGFMAVTNDGVAAHRKSSNTYYITPGFSI